MSVYFISARELDLVKIGYAYNPVARWKHLRTFSPVELTLEGAIPGGFNKERELHRRYALARARGEWFRMCPAIQREIDVSSRPEKYTWASVRLWIKKLIEADNEISRAAIPPEVGAQIEERIRSQFERSAARAGMTELQRREFDGEIYFPFREMADA